MRHMAGCASGTCFVPELGAYGGWVAHPGSYAERQCTSLQTHHTALLFCGECFVDPGPQCSLAERYEVLGAGFVASLNGLFSGLLLDRARGRALLFNDRYGGERIYVAEEAGALYFASEAKALLAVLPALRAFDDVGVAQYLAFGTTLGERTLFKGIARLPGGSLWRAAAGCATQKSRYFSPAAWEASPPLPADEWESCFAQAFGRVLPAYAQSDSPVGLSLTGGLDTRMILACLPKSARPLLTYTYTGGDPRLLDLRIARRVAAARGLPHHALQLGPEFLHDFGRHVDRTVYVTDGAAGALAAHEIPLSTMAGTLAPIRLTGNFGSEVLRSMSTFKRQHLDPQLLDGDLSATVQAQVDEQRATRAHPVTRAAFEEIPWHLFGTWAAARSVLTVRTPFLDNEVVAVAYRAPEALRQSSAAALRLIQAADSALAAIPTDRGLRAGAPGAAQWGARLFCGLTFKLDYWHKEGLPDRLSWLDPLLDARLAPLGLHKFLPYRLWFRRELAPYLGEVVDDASTRGMPWWNAETLRHLVPDHVAGRRNGLREIAAVLTLASVQRTLLSPQAWASEPQHELPARMQA